MRCYTVSNIQCTENNEQRTMLEGTVIVSGVIVLKYDSVIVISFQTLTL